MKCLKRSQVHQFVFHYCCPLWAPPRPPPALLVSVHPGVWGWSDGQSHPRAGQASHLPLWGLQAPPPVPWLSPEAAVVPLKPSLGVQKEPNLLSSGQI